MRELFNIIQANPWPFGAGLLVVVLRVARRGLDHHCRELWRSW
jgi:hypothetical protein